MKKASLTATLLALGITGPGTTLHAALSISQTLTIDSGVYTCNGGAGTPPDDCSYGSNVPTGSWFGLDLNASGTPDAVEKVALAPSPAGTGALLLGWAQAPGDIDATWTEPTGTGTHWTRNALAIIDDGAGDGIALLDGSGWAIEWNGNAIDLVDGNMTITCGNQCEVGDTYVLEFATAVESQGVMYQVPYHLHLEGTIGEVPLPAALWLFGSGLLGLVAVARRRKSWPVWFLRLACRGMCQAECSTRARAGTVIRSWCR